jgi:type II secretory pathway pseudopilin PulG
MNKTTFTKQYPGFAAVIAPVIIGLLGMLGAAGVSRLDHQAVVHRDVVRLQQIQELQTALKEYKKQTGSYPIQKDERLDGREVLIKALVTDTKILTEVPQDPKLQDNWDYRYWSEGSVYSFRYLLESNPRQEQLVYGQGNK